MVSASISFVVGGDEGAEHGEVVAEQARNSSTSWVTTPMRLRNSTAGRSRTSMPPTRMAPDSVSQRRATRRPMVVLPLPVRPTMPTVVPAATWRLTSCRTSVPVP